VFILVQCNKSLSRNYVAHSITVDNVNVCESEFWKKKFVCAFWLSVHCIGYHMKSVVEQGFFHKFAFDKKVLKTFVKFRTAENVRSSNVV